MPTRGQEIAILESLLDCYKSIGTAQHWMSGHHVTHCEDIGNTLRSLATAYEFVDSAKDAHYEAAVAYSRLLEQDEANG